MWVSIFDEFNGYVDYWSVSWEEECLFNIGIPYKMKYWQGMNFGDWCNFWIKLPTFNLPNMCQFYVLSKLPIFICRNFVCSSLNKIPIFYTVCRICVLRVEIFLYFYVHGYRVQFS